MDAEAPAQGRAQLTDRVAPAPAVWLGVHAVRAFLATVVWNIREDLPPNRPGLLFASPDVESLSASISRTTASDHLPVLVRVRLR